jgi:hypothetical protein
MLAKFYYLNWGLAFASSEQSPQETELQAAGVEKIFKEKLSGAAQRPLLILLQDRVSGDHYRQALTSCQDKKLSLVDSSLLHFRRKAPVAESIGTILLSELSSNILRAANSTKLGHLWHLLGTVTIRVTANLLESATSTRTALIFQALTGSGRSQS